METKPEDESGGTPSHAPSPRGFPWLEMCALLSVVQIIWAGYRFGTGNQAIQIAFLKRLLQPQMYPGDPLVDTIARYPSWFFDLLSLFTSLQNLPQTYFILHCLATFGTLVACYLLGQAMFRDRATGVVSVLLLLAGHQQALASTTLCWQEFTHTWFAFPIAVFTLVLFFRGRYLAAFILAGILFNLHALTSAYLLPILCVGVLAQCKNLGYKKTVLCFACFILAALPTLINLWGCLQPLDDSWLRLVRIRSSPHSFPLSWWQAGDSQIPRFILVLGFAILALGFPMPSETWRKTRLATCAIVCLFAIGFAGSEIWPCPAIVRAQLFRSSSLLLLLALVIIAHGIASGWSSASRLLTARGLRFPTGWVEWCGASIVFLALAVPDLAGMLPAAFVCATLVALATGRLHVAQAGAAGIIFVFTLIAWRTIHFPLLAPPTACSLEGVLRAWELWAAVSVVVAVLLAAKFTVQARTRLMLCPSALAATVILLYSHYVHNLAPAESKDSWIQAQLWAKEHTSPEAVFLTPSFPGGFRLHSERAIVGEWRDGTQQYFDADFARLWWRRMEDLLPGMRYDARGTRLIAKPLSIACLTDDELAARCKKYHVSHIVLPRGAERGFVTCYENADWVVYRSDRKPRPEPPDGVVDPLVWRQQEEFLASTVLPNIEKHRKSDVRIQIVDPEGRPLQNARYEITQTDSLFRFGCSLGYFVHPPLAKIPEASAYDTQEKELEYLPQIFNFSIVGYSGKWVVMEPERGKYLYDDMDRYVDWCQAHNIKVQFHFISGYEPAWMKDLSPAVREERFNERASALLERYGNRIHSWQVVNEKHLLQQSPSVFKLMKEKDPNVKLGISDCAVFWSDKPPPAKQKDLERGLVEQIRWLKSKGAAVDFVGPHGHRPFPLWPDARDVYALFDELAKEDVRIYVTEFGTQLGAKMCGPVRAGVWDDELQAQYYELAFTIFFSHPAVDGINFWGIGPKTFVPGAGLLDNDYNPKAAFHRLKKLVRETWRTRLSGSLGLDGSVDFRGFHGEYQATVRIDASQVLMIPFTVTPDATNRLRLVVDRAKGTIAVAPSFAGTP